MKRTTLHAGIFCLLLTATSCSSKTDPLIDLRNNWYSYISVEPMEYRFSILKSINALEIPIQNNTDYVLDKVVIAVNYIKQAGGIYNTEQVTIYDIPPHSIKIGKLPDSPGGASIDFEIMNIMSTGMKFIYPGSRSNAMDPYLYN
jgi:hypothetical protein